MPVFELKFHSVNKIPIDSRSQVPIVLIINDGKANNCYSGYYDTIKNKFFSLYSLEIKSDILAWARLPNDKEMNRIVSEL